MHSARRTRRGCGDAEGGPRWVRRSSPPCPLSSPRLGSASAPPIGAPIARKRPLSIAPVPAEHLALRLAAPEWFRWAIGKVPASRMVTVEGCPIHYLAWPPEGEAAPERGLLFVHGGGAHAHWWAFVAPYFIRDFRVVAIDLSGMGDSG